MANEKDPHDTDKIATWFSNGLIVMILALLWTIVVSLLKAEVPDKNRDAIMLIVGGLIGHLSTKINYDFGSSASSSRNAKRLDKEREAKDQAQAQVNDQQAQVVEQVIEKEKEKK